jgi:hypothetical protein
MLSIASDGCRFNPIGLIRLRNLGGMANVAATAVPHKVVFLGDSNTSSAAFSNDRSLVISHHCTYSGHNDEFELLEHGRARKVHMLGSNLRS